LKNLLVEYRKGVQTLDSIELGNAIQTADDKIHAGNPLFVESFQMITDTSFDNVKVLRIETKTLDPEMSQSMSCRWWSRTYTTACHVSGTAQFNEGVPKGSETQFVWACGDASVVDCMFVAQAGAGWADVIVSGR